MVNHLTAEARGEDKQFPLLGTAVLLGYFILLEIITVYSDK
jgi:hypothetical protein